MQIRDYRVARSSPSNVFIDISFFLGKVCNFSFLISYTAMESKTQGSRGSVVI
jgi:hypothetical protein